MSLVFKDGWVISGVPGQGAQGGAWSARGVAKPGGLKEQGGFGDY